MPQVFLSYSRKDAAFVRERYWRLTRDGVKCFLDEASIAWGEDWVLALEQGLTTCDIIVFVLTPDFCQSTWTEIERTGIMAADPAGAKHRVLPLLLKP